MPIDHRAVLAKIKRFDQLVAYLRDEMGWPISRDSFEETDDLFYDFTADELGIDPKTAAKIESIKRLRPLSPRQPFGIFFVKFEPKRLPVVALRRILGQVALKKRASAASSVHATWALDDLLFISNYGEGEERQISFAHFSKTGDGQDLPTLKVLGWDNLDTALHLDAVAKELTQHLAWPEDESDIGAWRANWRAAFTLQNLEVVTTSKQLSIRLAELARAIRDRIKAALAIETDRGPLRKLMKAFQESLVHDLDVDGFADMYAQTIAYGLLSARIADPNSKTVDDFARHMRTNPFLRELMETFLKVGGRRGKAGGPGIDFDELGVSEVVRLLDEANMDAVVRDFGDRNSQEDPVIHFYERFLSAYNKQLKVRRGVFYTPQPVVVYLVRGVHELLQSEFGLADGLADTTTWGEMLKKHVGLILPPLTDAPAETRTISPDEPFVQVLDPAVGTGTFLVEVIEVIHRTLTAKWKQQQLTDAQRRAAWNEYVPKHLLPRLHGYELIMAPYAIAHMKVGLKLAETGYRFTTDERARIYLTNALEPWVNQLPLHGLDALAHEAAAVNQIKWHKRFTVVLGNPPYSGNSQNRGVYAAALVSRYKRNLTERKINLDDDYIKFVALAEHAIRVADVGVVGIITNNTYIDGLTLRAMRHELLETFNHVHIVDLHGSTAKKERAVDGSADENVFDIEQGVAIALMARHLPREQTRVEYADVRGRRQHKYDLLLTKGAIPAVAIQPHAPDFFFITRSHQARDEWKTWPSLADTMTNKSGFMSQRDDFIIDEDASVLSDRVKAYFDSPLQGDLLAAEFGLHDYRNFSVDAYRRTRRFDSTKVTRCLFRPFDYRYVYYDTTIVQQASSAIMQHFQRPNIGLVFMRQVVQERGGYNHFFVTRFPTDHRSMRSNRGYANVAPLFLYPGPHELLGRDDRRVNLSPGFLKDLRTVIDDRASDYDDIFAFMYATFHSSAYRQRYAEYLKIDFPRIPLPASPELFADLASVGNELISIHLMESSTLDQFITTFTGTDATVGRVAWYDETVWLDAAARLQRGTTCSFSGVTEAVWKVHVGGYQVCEKWLKDRKGRVLTADDIAHYQKIIVALSETIRLMSQVDAVINRHGGWPGAFVTADRSLERSRPVLKVAESDADYDT